MEHAIVELVAEMPEQITVVQPVLDRIKAQLRKGPISVGNGIPGSAIGSSPLITCTAFEKLCRFS